MDQEISSAINRELYHLMAPAHNRNMNANRNAKGLITELTHLNVRAELALENSDIIITAAGTVAKGVMDLEEN